MTNEKKEQLINTQEIITAATELRNANDNISSKFRIVTEKADLLKNDWNSSAGDVAFSKMYQLFNYSETRYSVIQNYINVLEQQVNPNYQNAEETNKTLADQFK